MKHTLSPSLYDTFVRWCAESVHTHCSDEELGAVCIGASIGHRQQAGLGVGELEVLVCEFFAIDGLAARPVATREVTALQHKVRDDAVELRARIAKALFTRAQRAEILGGLGHLVAVEAKVDLAWPEKRYALKSDILRGSTGLSPGQDSD